LNKVRPLYLTRYERDALASEVKDTVRFPVTADNSGVRPGSFEGLDLETGRARRDPVLDFGTIRARCRFPSGATRAVTVWPVPRIGDLFWVKEGGAAGRRSTSQWTLEVIGVESGRLQDLSDKDALREGAALMRPITGEQLSPRETFAAAWNDRYGRDRGGRLTWRANQWVWIVRVRRHRLNVDELLKIGTGAAVLA
jgi:hypothetical protein